MLLTAHLPVPFVNLCSAARVITTLYHSVAMLPPSSTIPGTRLFGHISRTILEVKVVSTHVSVPKSYYDKQPMRKSSNSSSSQETLSTGGSYSSPAIVYGCVPLTILFAITILILRLRGHAFTGWGFESSSPRASHSNSNSNSNWKSKLPRATIWAVNVYGLILTPLKYSLCFSYGWSGSSHLTYSLKRCS
jgi:hypothetical protein